MGFVDIIGGTSRLRGSSPTTVKWWHQNFLVEITRCVQRLAWFSLRLGKHGTIRGVQRGVRRAPHQSRITCCLPPFGKGQLTSNLLGAFWANHALLFQAGTCLSAELSLPLSSLVLYPHSPFLEGGVGTRLSESCRWRDGSLLQLLIFVRHGFWH